jgi:hypothetical protein
MAVITYLGKFLIVASILFQAFLLYQDKKEGDQFNKNLSHAISSCPSLQALKPHLQQHLRLVVVGLLGTSALMLLLRASFVKVFTLLGLIVLLWVEHHAVFCKVPSLELLNNAPFWHSLGVVGAIIYLAAAECTGGKKAPKAVPERQSERTASNKPAPRTKGQKRD